MDKFDIHTSTPMITLRRASVETSIEILKPVTSNLRRLSLTSTPKQTPPSRRTSLTPVSESPTPSTLSTALYHLRTAHLFVKHDFKTILIPQTIFGLVTAYSTTAPTTPLSTILLRTPLILTWILLNLLPFCMDNQRQPGSLTEDALNKPWRPLPSHRLTQSQTYTAMLLSYFLALTLSLTLLGGTSMTIFLMVLGYIYNDLSFAERGILGRQVLTALGYAAFGVGALMVALPGGQNTLDSRMWTWVAMLASMIATTGQMTDLPDLEGDRQRGRKTAPIVWGEDVAKISVALPVLVWSVICPAFWQCRFVAFVVPGLMGVKIVERLFTTAPDAATIEQTSGKWHKGTFKIWNAWVAVLYFLPLFAERV